MKIAKSFTTLYYTTRRNIPEDLDLKLHRRENLKSHMQAIEIYQRLVLSTVLNYEGRCTRVYPKVSGLAAWSDNCKWYSSLPLGAVVLLFCESV
jgi:hypothetical protein